MYYQLHDRESEEILGTVKVTNETESWDEYNRCEESEKNPEDVDEFVEWNNENRVTQLERIYLEFCQPS